jgi:hypothetical protein
MRSYLSILLFLPFACYGQLEETAKRDILEFQIQQHYSNAFTRPAENTVNWQETKSYLDTAIIPCVSNSIGLADEGLKSKEYSINFDKSTIYNWPYPYSSGSRVWLGTREFEWFSLFH